MVYSYFDLYFVFNLVLYEVIDFGKLFMCDCNYFGNLNFKVMLYCGVIYYGNFICFDMYNCN